MERNLIAMNYEKYGILHKKICVETPQQNVVAERKYQHIMNGTHSFPFQPGLRKNLRYYVATHVIHLINKFPSSILKDMSKMLYRQPPTYLNLKTFEIFIFCFYFIEQSQ